MTENEAASVTCKCETCGEEFEDPIDSDEMRTMEGVQQHAEDNHQDGQWDYEVIHDPREDGDFEAPEESEVQDEEEDSEDSEDESMSETADIEEDEDEESDDMSLEEAREFALNNEEYFDPNWEPSES